jgi:large subunit ribosomal protein L10
MPDENKKISTKRKQKEVIVDDLADKVSKSKALIFTNYQGLTHKQLEGFKKAIKPLESDYVVAKNTLVLRGLDKAGVKIEDPASLDGPTGTMFLYGDIVEPLKKLAKIIKELSLPTVKFGILDNQALTSDQVLKLATLPSRETLIAQVVGGLKSPIFGLHRALNWNLQKLVMTLNAVSQKKPAEAVATPSTPAPVQAPEEKTEPEPTETPAQATETAESEQPAEEIKTQEQTEAENSDNETKKDEGGEN